MIGGLVQTFPRSLAASDPNRPFAPFTADAEKQTLVGKSTAGRDMYDVLRRSLAQIPSRASGPTPVNSYQLLMAVG